VWILCCVCFFSVLVYQYTPYPAAFHHHKLVLTANTIFFAAGDANAAAGERVQSRRNFFLPL
jgi:hypothetical protein